MAKKFFRIKEANFSSIVKNSCHKYRKRIAVRNWRDDNSDITYAHLECQVNSIAYNLIKLGFQSGDKIAILGEGSTSWVRSYLGIVLAGAIAVPILPDFSENEVVGIIKESGATGIFVNGKHSFKIYSMLDKLKVFRLEDLFYIPPEIKWENTKTSFMDVPGKDTKDTVLKKNEIKAVEDRKRLQDDLASIIYTSGTTGNSKGVMLTHGNLIINADACTDPFLRLKAGYRFLSILPLSHVYEFTLSFLVPFITGAEITYLNRPPTPSALMPALKDVRPHIMFSVPLLIEKIYRRAVLPKLKGDDAIGRLYRNPITRPIIYRSIGAKLRQTFGGRLKFLGVGGAPLDLETEKFLYKAHFPYGKGYGLTETSPMVAGCGAKDHNPKRLGRLMKNLEVKLSDEGEILVKGPTVMKGYYNNSELTKESFTEDGFFKTGDLGEIKHNKYLSLNGRSKNVILGPSGENIYPESIESIINNQDYVMESLVIPDETGGLLAMIKIDLGAIAKNFKLDVEESNKKAREILKNIHEETNKQLGAHAKVKKVQIQDEPFVRTPTEKIKRYLYQKKNKK